MSNILSVVYYFLNRIATALLSDASSSSPQIIQRNDEIIFNENYSDKEMNRNLKNKKFQKNNFYKKRNEFDEKFTIEVYDDNDDDDDDLMDFNDKEFIQKIMKRENENLYENENENETETEYNNNCSSTELTDFEKEILEKYMKEYQENNNEMVIEHNNNNNNNIIINDDNNNNNNNENDTISLQSASTSSFSSAETSDVRINSLSHQLSNNNNNNSNNFNRVNSNSHRNRDIRRNLSVWVGVTSCVWGLLLYFVKSYM